MKKLMWSSYRVGKSGFMVIVYGIFLVYILNLVVQAPLISTKIIFGVIGLGVLAIALYFDYLKRLYSKMIYQLTIKCDIPEAEAYRSQLFKQDFVKGFKKSLILFDSLLLMDKGQYDDCLTHIQNHFKFFHSTLDYLFIFYHTQLHIAYFLDDTQLAKAALAQLNQLKNTPKKKLRPLFSWHEIKGIEYYLDKRYNKSLQEFEQINRELLNNRELLYVSYMKAQTLFALDQQQAASQLLQTMNAEKNTIIIGRKKI